MSDLSPEARAWIEAHRDAHAPPAGAKARVRARIVAPLAPVLGPSVARSPRTVSLAAAIAGAVVAAMGGALVGWALRGNDVAPPPRPPTATSVDAPLARAHVSESNDVVVSTADDSSRPQTTPTRAPIAPPAASIATAPREDASLAEEVALLRRANAALQQGDGRGALATIDEHARRFPDGVLAEEREVERVVALCALGRDADAARATDAFFARYPTSSHADRVRSACARDE